MQKTSKDGPRPKEDQQMPEDHHQRMRLLAHQRLDRLFDEATAARFYGRISLEVTFENGRPLVIHRHIEGVDK